MAESSENKAELQKNISSMPRDVSTQAQDDAPRSAGNPTGDGTPATTADSGRPTAPQRSGQSIAEAVQARLDKTASSDSRPGAPKGTITRLLRNWTHSRLFCPGLGTGASKRKAIVVLVPLAAVIMVLAYFWISSHGPQETEAATSGAPANFAGRSGLIVRGIVFSEQRPSAVVGTQMVHVGDTIGDVTIVQINKNSVVFEKAGRQWVQEIGN